jgi:hypothetical protein
MPAPRYSQLDLAETKWYELLDSHFLLDLRLALG